MPEYARVCKSMPEYAIVSHSEPEWVKESSQAAIMRGRLFCSDMLKYGIFCRNLLKYTLIAEKIAESVLRADSTLYPTLVVPNLLPFQSVCNQAREAARINLCVTERRDIAHRRLTHRLTSQAIDAEEPFGHDTKRRGVKRGIHQTYFFSLWISELCYMRWRWVFGFIQFVWSFCSRGNITNSSSICSYYFDKSKFFCLLLALVKDSCNGFEAEYCIAKGAPSTRYRLVGWAELKKNELNFDWG